MMVWGYIVCCLLEKCLARTWGCCFLPHVFRDCDSETQNSIFIAAQRWKRLTTGLTRFLKSEFIRLLIVNFLNKVWFLFLFQPWLLTAWACFYITLLVFGCVNIFFFLPILDFLFFCLCRIWCSLLLIFFYLPKICSKTYLIEERCCQSIVSLRLIEQHCQQCRDVLLKVMFHNSSQSDNFHYFHFSFFEISQKQLTWSSLQSMAECGVDLNMQETKYYHFVLTRRYFLSGTGCLELHIICWLNYKMNDKYCKIAVVKNRCVQDRCQCLWTVQS